MTPDSLAVVAVIGNGIIGHGVAQIFAMAGKPVILIGRNADSLGLARQKIADSLADFVRHGLVAEGDVTAILDRVAPLGRLDGCRKGAIGHRGCD